TTLTVATTPTGGQGSDNKINYKQYSQTKGRKHHLQHKSSDSDTMTTQTITYLTSDQHLPVREPFMPDTTTTDHSTCATHGTSTKDQSTWFITLLSSQTSC
ncbi:hypothetical protein, partial [Corynebacterium bovis]|uniref:hypothetical protein n=1 Tax=Corynebacterium bovis TaxID=36808 RepID=UPI001ED97928